MYILLYRKVLVRTFVGALSLVLSTVSPVAQEKTSVRLEGRRTMEAARMHENEIISLDGVLDEPVWQRAIPARDFVQQDPLFGGEPTERTEVRVAVGEKRLYMGVTCFDSEPDKLLGNTMKRDAFLSSDDRCMWVFDTFLDARSGYFFEMNPSGLMADSLLGTGGTNERSWDGIWNAKVRHSEIGWTLEIVIPFRTLSLDPEAPAWGINFQRTIRRKNEENLWTAHARNQGLRHLPSAGLLKGLGEVSRGLGLDVKPYVVINGTELPASGQNGLDGDADAGVDFLYKVTPGLRANFTVNTDFAQTEVDDQLVNLTQFSTRFPEKRDFFLDGATFFNFYRGNSVEPFFSRRIGLAGGKPQKIDFGVKLNGLAGGQDIGFLQVRTGETAESAGEDFTVLRIRRRLLAQSYVGTLYTRRSERVDGSPDLQTAGLDFEFGTSSFRGSQNLRLNGFLLWNSNPLKKGENLAHGLQFSYPNDPFEASMSFLEIQKNYDPAIGFTRRRGYRQYSPSFEFSQRPRGHKWIRQLAFGVELDLQTDMGNRWLTREIELNLLNLDTHSRESLQFEVTPGYERLTREFRVHPGVVLPSGEEYSFLRYRVGGSTSSNRVLSTRATFAWGGFFSGHLKEALIDLSVRPRPGLKVTLEGEWNWVNLPEGVFQARLYRTLMDLQFSPWMQFANTIQFDSVSGVMGWQSRFRWIFRPGNDLFLVYAHNWFDDPLDPRDSFRTLDRNAASKLVYTHRF